MAVAAAMTLRAAVVAATLAAASAASPGPDALRRWWAAHNASVAWSMDSIMGAAAAGTVLGAPDSIGNASLCGAVGPGSPEGSCFLRYHWGRDQLYSATDVGGAYGSVAPTITGRHLSSAIPIGRVSGVHAAPLAHALGDGGYVLDMWVRGPALRTAGYALFFISTDPVLNRNPLSPVLFVNAGQSGSDPHTKIDFSGVLLTGTTLRVGGPNHQTGPASTRTASPQQSGGTPDFLGSWHHIVVVAGRRHSHNMSSVAWFNGAVLNISCLGTPGILVGSVGSEPGLPSWASTACDPSRISSKFTYTIGPAPYNQSQMQVRVGADAWFNSPGTMATDAGGVLHSMSLTMSDRPMTLAARLSLSHSSPYAALVDMPVRASEASVGVTCRQGPMAPPMSGRVVCRARCADPGLVVSVSVGSMCRAGGWLRRVTDATGTRGLCDGTDESGTLMRLSTTGRSGPAGGRTVSVLSSSWSGPGGMSGVVGELGRVSRSSGADGGAEPVSSWVGRMAWGSVTGHLRDASVASSIGWMPRRPGAGGMADRGPMLTCERPSEELSLMHSTGQPAVLLLCLGGLVARPTLRSMSSVLSSSYGEVLAETLRIEVIQALGLGAGADSRVQLFRSGLLDAEDAASLVDALGEGMPSSGAAQGGSGVGSVGAAPLRRAWSQCAPSPGGWRCVKRLVRRRCRRACARL